jgi:cyclopropane fatty-acyl-phospholipid synthase-like methyltransferase
MSDIEREVRNFYDVNTALWFRRERESQAIHRAVWAPGVNSLRQAFEHVDHLILAEVRGISAEFRAPVHVLDLGCGIGGSLIFLASRAPIRATGVTVSGVQCAEATRRIAHARLTDRVACLETSYLNLPDRLDPAHLAFSIEAFVHGPNPAAYFASTARHLVSGGLLVICDDFLTARARGRLTTREARLIDDVRRGWLAHSLISTDEANDHAERAGYDRVKDVDLTPHLDLRRPRDLVVSLAVMLGRPFASSGYWWRSLVGGNALQLALASGLIQFRFKVWRRAVSSARITSETERT